MWFSNNTNIPGLPSLPDYMRTFNLDNNQDWSQVETRLTPGYETPIDFSFDWTAVCFTSDIYGVLYGVFVRITRGEPRAQPPCIVRVEWLEETLTVVLWEDPPASVLVEASATDLQQRGSALMMLW